MARNVIREIRNQVRAESRMKIQMDKAREKVLARAEEYISSLYTEGQETVDFRFDAFQLWGKSVGAEEVFDFLRKHELYTDNWCRGVFSLSKEQAIELKKLVEEWNADWEYRIAGEHNIENQMDYYNAYRIAFDPASGTEHTIDVYSPNGSRSDSWQWSKS